MSANRKFIWENLTHKSNEAGKDSPDVKHNMKGCHIECKKTEHLRIWEALEQSNRDAGEDEIPVVVFSRNRSKDYVALSFEDFLKVFKAYEEKEIKR